MDGAVGTPEDEHIRPLDRGHVGDCYAVTDRILQAARVFTRDLDHIVAEVAPRPELDAVLAEQVPVDAQAHGIARSSID